MLGDKLELIEGLILIDGDILEEILRDIEGLIDGDLLTDGDTLGDKLAE